MTRSVMGGMLGLIVAVAAGRSLAQTAPTDVAGPFKFALGLRAEYTDNRDSAPSAQEESTFDYFVAPRIDLILDGRTSFLDFYYAPSYRYRQDPGQFDDNSELFHDLQLHVRGDVSPNLALRAGEIFQYTDDPTTIPGEPTGRNNANFLVSQTDVGGRYRFTPITSLDLNALYRMKRYDEAIYEVQDETSLAGQLQLWRQVARSIGLFGEVGAEDFTYENQPGEDPSFTRMNGGVGVEALLSNTLRLSARGGFSDMEFETDSVDSEVYPYIHAVLRVLGTPTVRFNGGFSHLMRDADVVSYAWQTVTDLFAGVEWDAGEKLLLGLTGTFRVGDYDSDASVANLPGGSEDTILIRGRVAYKVGERSTVELAQQYEDVDSDVSTTYQRNTTSLGVRATF